MTQPAGGAGFGRSGLRFQRKIFAMLVRSRLVLKLPAARVDELIEAGEGVHFETNKGTPGTTVKKTPATGTGVDTRSSRSSRVGDWRGFR